MDSGPPGGDGGDRTRLCQVTLNCRPACGQEIVEGIEPAASTQKYRTPPPMIQLLRLQVAMAGFEPTLLIQITLTIGPLPDKGAGRLTQGALPLSYIAK